ncbi:MAG: chemotaxis protein CheW [Candidatus Acidiferrales bacterium]
MTAAAVIAKSSFVLLQLGRRRFGLPAAIVTELAPPVKLHVFAHQTPMVAGVIVRRGRVIPVYDVTPVLVGKKLPERRFYLVASRKIEGQEELSAIPVDGECELVNAELFPTPEDSPKYVAGVLAIGEETIEILDFEKLVRTSSAPPAASPVELGPFA